MALWSDWERRFSRFRLIDAKLAQATAFFLALVLAKAVPELLSVSIWWFAAAALACAVRPAILFFR